MPGGESNYITFGYETTFKTAATANRVFGENVTIRTADLKNNLKRLFRLGGRNAVDLVANKFEGALSVEFDLADPQFMKGVMGTDSFSGTSPYYHNYYEANLPPSLTVENGISGVVRRYLGCIISDCRISVAVGDEPAKVSLTMLYADETTTSGAAVTQTAPTDTVYPFSYGSFEYPTGTTIADTESVEMTITNTAALKWAIGSRKASRYDMRQRQYDISTTNYFDDAATYLRKAYGYTTSGTFQTSPVSTLLSGEAGVKIVLDNGLLSSQKRTWNFIFTGGTIERHGLPQAVEQENMETIEIIPKSAVIQCFNNTSGNA